MSIFDYFGVERRAPQGRSQEELLAREQALIDAARAAQSATQENPRFRQPTVSKGFTRGGRGGFQGPSYTPYTTLEAERAAAARDAFQRAQLPAGTFTPGPEYQSGAARSFTSTDPGPRPAAPAIDSDTFAANRVNFANLPPTQTEDRPSIFGDDTTGGGGGAGGIGFTPLGAARNLTFDPMNIDRSLYALEETAAERQALQDARADLDARARAGAQAIVNTWRTVEQSNRAAAEKARTLSRQYGAEAAGLWTNAANQAREASVLRAAAAMANAGRAPIDLDPMAGGGAFVAAMESLAMPEAERAFAEGAMQAERSDWAADMAAAQSSAYQGELQRTSMIMAADMAREHNARVLERIGRERLALSESERETGMFNRQMQEQVERGNIERQFAADQFNAQQRQAAAQFNAQLRAAASGGRSRVGELGRFVDDAAAAIMADAPEDLAAAYGISVEEAQRRMDALKEFQRLQNIQKGIIE